MIASHYKLFILALYLDAYALFFINERGVTLGMILFGASGIYGLLCFVLATKSGISISSSNAFAVLMFFWVWIVGLVFDFPRITNLLLYSSLFIAFSFNNNSINEKNYRKMINFFCQTMNVFAIYGILQLLFREEQSHINIENFDLFNLALPGHMLLGFNWSNPITFGGVRFWRSNAIFIEPSVFSRFLAINIIFHLVKSGKTKFVWIIINAIAYICTFSGTGLILFASCILTCIIKSNNVFKKNILKSILITFILIVAVLPLVIDASTVIDYFAGRLLEITSKNFSYSSGATRFVYSWYLLFSALSANLFWGHGPLGIDALRNIASGINVGGWVSEGNGFIQMTSQYGLVGLLFTVMIILRLKGRKSPVIYQNIFWAIVLVYPFIGGIVNSTWFIFASLANVNITNKYVESKDIATLIENNHNLIS